MKLISLNIWGGVVYEPLMEFVKNHSSEADVFCFQEVFSTQTDKKTSNKARANVYQELCLALPDFAGYFDPAQDSYDQDGFVDFLLSYGLATFVRKNIKVKEHGDIFVFLGRNSKQDDYTTIGRNLQYFVIENDGKEYGIFNLHGLWNGGGKADSETRIEQSEKVRECMDKMNIERKILCGDFNLLPDTKSLAILREGMRDLIKEYGIKSTRSHFYTKEVKFADYAIVSSAIKVKNFSVLPDVVSDHLPLILEFE